MQQNRVKATDNNQNNPKPRYKAINRGGAEPASNTQPPVLPATRTKSPPPMAGRRTRRTARQDAEMTKKDQKDIKSARHGSGSGVGADPGV